MPELHELRKDQETYKRTLAQHKENVKATAAMLKKTEDLIQSEEKEIAERLAAAELEDQENQ